MTFFLAPAVHQRADAVLARIAVLTQRAKGVYVWPTSKPKILELVRKDNPIVSDNWTSNKLKLVHINRRFPWHIRVYLSASGHRGLIVSDIPTLLSLTTVKNDMAIKRSQDTDINI